MLQCVAVCCSVLQCAATSGRDKTLVIRRLYIAEICCSVLQCVAVCCGMLQCVAVCCSVLQCVAVCCSVLQCVAVCCSVLPCVVLKRDGGQKRGRGKKREIEQVEVTEL